MRYKMVKILVFGVICLFLVVTSAFSTTFTWTDNTSGVGGTFYSLDLTADTLTAQTSTHSGWYIDWISFKLDGGTATTFSGLTGPTGAWAVQNNFPQSTWSGFSVTGTLPPANETIVQTGALLSGTTYTWKFAWTLGGAPLNPTPSIQVGYYDGLNTNGNTIFSTRMSQEFGVPEPGTLVLLGFGLVGLWAARKKSKK